MLGLTPEGLDGRLRIIRPLLPEFVDRLEVRRLQVGKARADLLFQRSARGTATDILRIDGDLEIVVED